MTAIAQAAPIISPEFAPTRSRLAAWLARIGTILRQLGPYAAIEILLPGGTLMALLLWLYRRSVYVRARVRTQESAAYAHLCMECGVANGHFELVSALRPRSDVTEYLEPR
jgi:hypothetical protein